MRTQRKTKTINLELGGRVVSVKAVRANLPQGTQGYAGLNYNLRVYSGSDNSGVFNRDEGDGGDRQRTIGYGR